MWQVSRVAARISARCHDGNRAVAVIVFVQIVEPGDELLDQCHAEDEIAGNRRRPDPDFELALFARWERPRKCGPKPPDSTTGQSPPLRKPLVRNRDRIGSGSYEQRA